MRVLGFPKLGVPFWGSHNKDYSILGSILGPPYFGKLAYHSDNSDPNARFEGFQSLGPFYAIEYNGHSY